MRILVTGGAGYIGSVLVPKLLARGHEVRVVDRMFWGLPHYAELPGVELVNADIRRLPEGVFEGIDAAVNRRTLDGKHPNGWFPEQKITVEEALRAYTWGSAYGGSQEHDRGTLARGFLADCVVLSRDILDPKERDRIGETRVLMTIVGGKIVYERK